MPLDLPRQAFAVHPIIGAPLGAEVVGLDLSRPLGAEDFGRLHRAHLDHHVLVFRDQHITPAEQVAFSRRFGQLQIHVLRNFQLTGHPEVLIVSNIRENGEPIGLGDAGHFWHSDLSYKETPSLGSMLHAQELPAEGGDTLFANQHTAWQALPDELKREVDFDWRVTAYDPGARMAVTSTSGIMATSSDLQFADANGATVVAVRIDAEPTGIMRLAEPMIADSIRSTLSTSLTRAKRMLEGS